MKVMYPNSDEYDRISLHEAGHYIANRFFGYVPDAIYFTYNKTTQGYSGGCEVSYPAFFLKKRDFISFCYKRCVILFAGSAAGALDNKSKKVDFAKAFDDFNAEAGLSDRIKYETLLRVYINFRYGFLKKHKINKPFEYFDCIFKKETVRIVEENATHIMGIASRLRSEIKKNLLIKEDFLLSYDDFNKMPAITKVFG